MKIIILIIQIIIFFYLIISIISEYKTLNEVYHNVNYNIYTDKEQEIDNKRKEILFNILSGSIDNNNDIPLFVIYNGDNNQDVEKSIKQDYFYLQQNNKVTIQDKRDTYNKKLLLEIPSINVKVNTISLEDDNINIINEKLID